MVLIGLEDDNQIGGSPDRDTAEAAPDFRERAAERIIRRVPGLIDGTFRTSHSGQDGLTPDQRPMLGAAGPGRLLPRLRPQRHGLQDRARRGPRDGGADPGRRGADRRPRAVRAGAVRGGPPPGRGARRGEDLAVARPGCVPAPAWSRLSGTVTSASSSEVVSARSYRWMPAAGALGVVHRLVGVPQHGARRTARRPTTPAPARRPTRPTAERPTDVAIGDADATRPRRPRGASPSRYPRGPAGTARARRRRGGRRGRRAGAPAPGAAPRPRAGPRRPRRARRCR